MKLIDIISLIDENQTVVVVNTENKEIARYDGRDSIPTELNDRTVEKISSIGFIAIMIK